mmetsp:Transcript_28580/g.51763  ORF Transcript_28580/g.51763 Transcript_28580/m.51763 type:complete len:92 (-) Transcript_28580:939-1214(-)
MASNNLDSNGTEEELNEPVEAATTVDWELKRQEDSPTSGCGANKDCSARRQHTAAIVLRLEELSCNRQVCSKRWKVVQVYKAHSPKSPQYA